MLRERQLFFMQLFSLYETEGKCIKMITKDNKSIKSNYTYEEIQNQVKTLRAAYEDIIKKDMNMDFLEKHWDEIIFFGCGTDYNLCQSAVFFSKSLMNNKSFLALPSSELLLNDKTYINKEKKYLVIGFSRSGETTESIDVLKRFKSRANISTFVFTARQDCTILKFSDGNFICREALEKSVAMTKAYTGFLFACCLIFAKFLNCRDIISEFNELIDFLDSSISKLFSDIESYINKNDFKKFFALGSGFNYGIAVEADLKMKEMAQINSFSYHLYEFAHGPKTMLDNESLCLLLTMDRKSPGIKDILKEIVGYGSRVLTVCLEDFTIIKNDSVINILGCECFKIDFVKSFLNIPVFQILAYLKAIKKGLDPDKPRNLNYTTKLKI